MGKHAKPRAFTLFRRNASSGASAERRTPGESWIWDTSQRGDLTEGSKDSDTLRRFLDGLRRQVVLDQGDAPLRITPEAVWQTSNYVLSSHLDEVRDEDLHATVLTMQGFLDALADAADSYLDTGRIVVREMIERARAATDKPGWSNRRLARHAAVTACELLSLLEREGWQAAEKEAVSA
ncbi:hypothetical protein ACFC36_15870 [Streptomyces rubiginosohelvolus]|uniref:hypothetical protein n=1 Tax=Streptomyces rubiginosohelvolus TaxID=67362 RepID=UPI0035DB55BB